MVSSNVFNPIVTFLKSGGKMGLLEVWMDIRMPHNGSLDPGANPGHNAIPRIDARIKVPNRTKFLVDGAKHTDPDGSYPDWDWTCYETDGGFCIDELLDMPAQAIFDETYMVVAGELRTYPLGKTGQLVVDTLQGGATNFLINWEKVAKAEFFELPAETPMSEWPNLEIELFGAISSRTTPSIPYSVRTTFKLLNTKVLSDLTRSEPAWLELAFDPELVLEESEPVNATFDAIYFIVDVPDNYDDARELIGTLIYKWVAPEPPAEKIEFIPA